jgi:hypothetical protein
VFLRRVGRCGKDQCKHESCDLHVDRRCSARAVVPLGAVRECAPRRAQTKRRAWRGTQGLRGSRAPRAAHALQSVDL